MPRVLRLRNDNNFDQLVDQVDNSIIVPVNDGNGDLVISVEILQDPKFSHLHTLINALTEEIEYVPFPDTESGLQQKLNELFQAGKLIRHDFINQECEYKNRRIKFKRPNQTVAEVGVMDKIGNAFKSAVQFVVDIFK